jgi:hypothetical protein
LNIHPNEWVQYTFKPQYVVQNHRDQNGVGTSVVFDQPHEISSLKLVINQGRDIIGGTQPRFVYQYTVQNYYELMED